MGIVDTIMVAPLGPAAIGAAGIGNALHIAFAIFGMGLLLGLDTLVSQAYGRKDIRDCHRWFFDGLMLAGLMALPIMALLVAVWFAIPVLHFHGEVKPLLVSYFGVLILSTPFLMFSLVASRETHSPLFALYALIMGLVGVCSCSVLLWARPEFKAA